MPSVQVEFTIMLESLECCACGMTFAMPVKIITERRSDHGAFFCPAGHRQYFAQETEAEKLKREIKRYQRQAELLQAEATFERDQRQAAERSLKSTKAQLTKTKKRVANGVCPCCNRTFQNLARHMTGKHPEYREKE